jgi:hypothetical protein
LKAVAIPCAAEIQKFDGQAFALIAAVKEKYRGASRGPASLVPPPPAALTDLQQQRDATVNAATDSLAGAFGPAQFAVFDARVRQYIGSHFTAATAG